MRILRDAAIIVVALIALARAAGILWPEGVDFRAYYYADLEHLYTGPWGQDAFLYSPAFAHATEPLRWLPFPVALGVWTALSLGVLVWLAGPWSLPLMLVLAPEWINGNVHLVMAGAVVVGLRYPAAFAFPLLTKLAPGVGVLWFVFRREWRKAAIATGATAAIVGISFALAPGLWFDYARFLVDSIAVGSAPQVGGYVPVPLYVRLPLAVALLWLVRKPWAVPIACALAMPVLWLSALVAFGLAALTLRRSGARTA